MLEEVDISGDDDLELQYGVRIPVVTVDGREHFEVDVDPVELARVAAGAENTRNP